MNNKTVLVSLVVILFISVGTILNITVTTKQGVNYHVSEIELPLYLKVLNFYDRHFNYKWLANSITKDLKTKEEMVFRLFQWTHETIRPQPKSLPIMDDHIWNVYVRGYGVADNFHDLFTTLCSYIGVNGVFLSIENKDLKVARYLSFVELEKGWVIFDPYKGAFFVNSLGGWATIEEIKKHDWKMKKLGPTDFSDSFYTPLLDRLPDNPDRGLNRSNTQSPINRILLAIQQMDF